jgi:hypothetical protein
LSSIKAIYEREADVVWMDHRHHRSRLKIDHVNAVLPRRDVEQSIIGRDSDAVRSCKRMMRSHSLKRGHAGGQLIHRTVSGVADINGTGRGDSKVVENVLTCDRRSSAKFAGFEIVTAEACGRCCVICGPDCAAGRIYLDAKYVTFFWVFGITKVWQSPFREHLTSSDLAVLPRRKAFRLISKAMLSGRTSRSSRVAINRLL